MTQHGFGSSAARTNDTGPTPLAGRNETLRLPHAVGAACLAASGYCAAWLRASEGLSGFSPVRALCLLAVCGFLVAATLLLLEDR